MRREEWTSGRVDGGLENNKHDAMASDCCMSECMNVCVNKRDHSNFPLFTADDATPWAGQTWSHILHGLA